MLNLIMVVTVVKQSRGLLGDYNPRNLSRDKRGKGCIIVRDANFSGNVKTVGNIPEISEKRYRPSTRFLKLKNACIYDRSRKECTFTLCSYPYLFARISRGMKYPALPASLKPYETHF